MHARIQGCSRGFGLRRSSATDAHPLKPRNTGVDFRPRFAPVAGGVCVGGRPQPPGPRMRGNRAPLIYSLRAPHRPSLTAGRVGLSLGMVITCPDGAAWRLHRSVVDRPKPHFQYVPLNVTARHRQSGEGDISTLRLHKKTFSCNRAKTMIYSARFRH
jgi:hypothetical protein